AAEIRSYESFNSVKSSEWVGSSQKALTTLFSELLATRTARSVIRYCIGGPQFRLVGNDTSAAMLMAMCRSKYGCANLKAGEKRPNCMTGTYSAGTFSGIEGRE